MKISEKLLKEWDFERNDKDPNTLTSGSAYRAWWKCQTCHHHWQSSIVHRSKGVGCPKCAGFKYIPLFEKAPHLEKEWDFERNEKDPHTLTSGSGYKAWWTCQTCDHHWQSSIVNRSNGGGCPKCAGREYKPLFEAAPHLQKEWDFEKNGKDPYTLTSGSGYKAWWTCATCHYDWEARIVGRSTGGGCPKCAGLKYIPLFEAAPYLEKEWDYKKNDKDPSTLTSGSDYKAWWTCHVCMHEWRTKVATRVRGSRCTRCYKRKKRKEIFFERPDLEKEWNYEKNERDPSTITGGSNYKAWWTCHICMHEWQARIVQRVKNDGNGTNCPSCAGFKYINLFEAAPHLQKEWDYKRNDKDPSTLTSASAYKAWWTCQACHHGWQTDVNERSRGSGCPQCAGFKHIPLFEKSPHLEKEWDFERNDKDPHIINSGSGYKAWWICHVCTNEWQAIVATRVKYDGNGSNCPKCAGFKYIPLFEAAPHLQKEWDFKKNEKDPHTLTSGSNYKAWWNCQTCQHNWQAVVAKRSLGSRCPSCTLIKKGVSYKTKAKEKTFWYSKIKDTWHSF